MKKIILLSLSLFLMFSVDAQKIGAKIGFDYSTISSENTDYNSNIGLNGAIFFQKRFLPFLSTKYELGFYQKGYNYELLTIKNTIVYDYVEFNAVANLKIPVIPIYAVVGPYVSYAISGKQSENMFNTTSDIAFGKDKTLPYDFGLIGGIGFVKSIAVIDFFAELRYEMGLLDINDYSFLSAKKNRNLAFSVGISIGL